MEDWRIGGARPGRMESAGARVGRELLGRMAVVRG